MDIESFLEIREFDKIDKRLSHIKEEMKLNSFNLFTISSYNSYLENFHSDIIALLLNPRERHGQYAIFLNLFLDYVISLGAQIDKNDYALSEISREKGKIDIWIRDNTSRKSIIVENKINNAEDRDNQLETYYNYAKESGFEVDAIIYLTLHGNKNAPWTDDLEINAKMLNIQAFNSGNDLSRGWLQECYDTTQDEHCRSFIFQYLKLIKHLSQTGMDRQIKDDFYKVINKQDGYNKTKAIAALVSGLEQYRTDLFMEKIAGDYLPFKKIYRWRPNHQLFENYLDNGILYKLDVQFLSDGNAQIDFWNPGKEPEEQKNNISSKLKSIDLYEEFEHGGFGGGMYKFFDMHLLGSIENVDNQLYDFVKTLFIKLR